MSAYLKHDEWSIVEEGFHPEKSRDSESLFSIGNGHMGQRANFEEKYSGSTLQGHYIAGIYYPDKTRVGWWKNGYPEYFAKVINAPSWIGIDVKVDGEMLDLAACKVIDFHRELNMKQSVLERAFTVEMPSGIQVKVKSTRFLSITEHDLGLIRYSITPLNKNTTLEILPYVDADVENEDSNYNEKFWEKTHSSCYHHEAYIATKTKKLDFHICTGMLFDVFVGGNKLTTKAHLVEEDLLLGNKVILNANSGEEIVVYKYAAVVTSLDNNVADLMQVARKKLQDANSKGFHAILKDHIDEWAKKWEHSDIVIEGDVAAQQGIRFNILQLNHTYTGKDARFNIGPKGFTGEKYGGSTYWDTEAYCLPFYMATAGEEVAKNLLVYRHNHLQRAIENAEKLGFTNGAALYPMVTMNGEECHNEWEITFEEIHRNGAIAFAVYSYVRYTGNEAYLADKGLEVLMGISRFWAQRITYSESKGKYVMLGVTGPNEYENNVNNNWYTNTIACWCMEYTIEAIEKVKKSNPGRYKEIISSASFNEGKEVGKWQDIISNMFFPYDEKEKVFLQQEGYMDKEQILVKDLDPANRPLNQKWSWDRILRSCYIKQADVLQGIYFFENRFDMETIKRNYEFYESRTVHESSLSPCVHSILAAKIGEMDQAYQLYLRTARLDLDDYNKEVREGLHITSMAGTWLSIVEGFGGMRVVDGKVAFAPSIPKGWKAYSFRIVHRGTALRIRVTSDEVLVFNEDGPSSEILVYGKPYTVSKNSNIVAKLSKR